MQVGWMQLGGRGECGGRVRIDCLNEGQAGGQGWDCIWQTIEGPAAPPTPVPPPAPPHTHLEHITQLQTFRVAAKPIKYVMLFIAVDWSGLEQISDGSACNQSVCVCATLILGGRCDWRDHGVLSSHPLPLPPHTHTTPTPHPPPQHPLHQPTSSHVITYGMLLIASPTAPKLKCTA